MGVVYAITMETPALCTFLEEENGSHSSKAESGVGSADGWCGALLVGRALGGGSSSNVGVRETAVAVVLALDQLLVLEVLEELAVELGRSLQVESTADALKVRGVDPVQN